MHRQNLLFFLIGGFLFALLMFGISKTPVGPFLETSVSSVFFSVGNILQSPFHVFSSKDSEVDQLKKENALLSHEVVALKALQNDNTALRDQFQTTMPVSTNLLPAHIVGMPTVIPNVSFPEVFIIDKGSKDNVVLGDSVVYQDNLVAKVSTVGNGFSEVTVITNKTIAIPAKDSQTNALGLLKGEGQGDMVFDNVLLSDNIAVGDIIVTQGSEDVAGKGYPPNLVIGKVTGVEKNPSALFQRAEVKSLVLSPRLSMVFIMTIDHR